MEYKQEKLESTVQQETCDIIAITETWWVTQETKVLATDGYKLLR